MPLQPYQERVVTEKTELDTKLKGLTDFIEGEKFPALDNAEKARLIAQKLVMEEYSGILGERIEAFSAPSEA